MLDSILGGKAAFAHARGYPPTVVRVTSAMREQLVREAKELGVYQPADKVFGMRIEVDDSGEDGAVVRENEHE